MHNAAVAREQVNFLFIVLGYGALAFLMSYAYPIGYKGGTPVKEGLRFGILVGLLVALPLNLILHGVWKVTLAGSLVDSIYHVIEQIVGGIIIALIYGNTSAKS